MHERTMRRAPLARRRSLALPPLLSRLASVRLVFDSKCEVCHFLGGEYIQLAAIQAPPRGVSGHSRPPPHGTAARSRASIDPWEIGERDPTETVLDGRWVERLFIF